MDFQGAIQAILSRVQGLTKPVGQNLIKTQNSLENAKNTLLQNVSLVRTSPKFAQQLPQMVNQGLQKATTDVYGDNPVTRFTGQTVGGMEEAFSGALTTGFTDKNPLEKAGDIVRGFGAITAPGEAIGFGILPTAIKGITNLATNRPITEGLNQEYDKGLQEGFLFSGATKLAKPFLNPLIAKVSPIQEASKIKALMDAGQLTKKQAISYLSGKFLEGGIPYGVVGAVSPAKDAQERITHVVANFLQGGSTSALMAGLGLGAHKFLKKPGIGLSMEDVSKQDLSPEEYLYHKSKQVGINGLDPDEKAMFMSMSSGDFQTQIQNPDLTKYEKAIHDKDLTEMLRLANKYPNDRSFHIHESVPKLAGEPIAEDLTTNARNDATLRELEYMDKTNAKGVLPNETNGSLDFLKQPVKDKADDMALGSNPLGRERGLVTSVHESPNISSPVSDLTQGTYTPKANSTLMGEAQALLQDGAKIDFKKVKNADQKVTATIQEAINLDQAGNHEAAANLYNNLAEHGTELGRGVQAFSLLDKMSPEAISLSVAGKIQNYNRTAMNKIPELGGDEQGLISNMVGEIQNMPAGRERNIAIGQLKETINSFIPSSLADKAITVWKAGLLTSLRTHERNLLGNSIMGGAEVAKDPIATSADMLMSLKTGQRTQTTTLAGLNEFTSPETRQEVLDTVRLGYDPNDAIGKFDVKQINWGKNPVERALKFYTDSVFRTLASADRPFYNAAYARSLYDQAGAQAINAGKQGDRAFVESLVTSPSEEMATTALKDAMYATFHDKNSLSNVANAIKTAARRPENGPIASELGKITTEVVAPFTGVPSSIVGKTIAYSPAGLLRGAFDFGRVVVGNVPELQRQAAQEIGRGILGTGLFGLGAYLASRGLMTGQPKDAKEAALWQAQGKQANSVLIGGKWRSINSIGPQNLIMLAGAKASEEMRKPEGSISNYAANLGKDQLSQTLLAGVQGPLNALTDPARYGQSYIGNQLSSIIPNIVKDTSKALDPFARETNSTLDYLKNNIPLLRNQSLVRRDNLGNPIMQEPTGMDAFVDLFNSKTPIQNPLVDELNRLNDTGNDGLPSKLTKAQTINGVKMSLSPEQLDTLEAQSGALIQERLNQLIASSDYQALSDEDKANAMQSIITQTRKQVRGGFDINAAANTTGQTPLEGAQESMGNSLQFDIINPDTGTVKHYDLSTSIDEPELTGNTELDKKLVAQYKTALNKRATDITTAYKAGKISAEDAEQMLQELATAKGSGKKPKKLSVKNVTFKAPSTKDFIVKLAKSKTPKITLPKVSFKTAFSPKQGAPTPPKFKVSFKTATSAGNRAKVKTAGLVHKYA